MNDSELYMMSIANTCREEPVFNCPKCNEELHTDWVDNGFGPYSVQASPYGCECGWHETGCNTCGKEKCFSWERCQGRALIVNPASGQSGINNMLDPNEKQATEEVKAAGQEIAAVESEAQEKAMESAEEGGTEG